MKISLKIELLFHVLFNISLILSQERLYKLSDLNFNIQILFLSFISAFIKNLFLI